MISKILVANRGEIARRVFRTCREMGIATVAVYSTADAESPHVVEADEAVLLPGQTSAETYLNPTAVIDAAISYDADAVHPGYGFLSENASFAEAVAAAGLTWIGPPPSAIRSMGSKVESKQVMAEAGVPILDGVTISKGFDPKSIPADWYPVLVKASAGGGGKGMRIVDNPEGLPEAIESAGREAEAAFGDGTLFVERYLPEPRHIEIQIMADSHGGVVSLHERECSIQRRHQKIIEEAPSPAISSELRSEMGAAAVNAARAVDYEGAGTVEFLFKDGRFFFLEMNTRLQVEHPVTEFVTGLDLVRLQIEVADGGSVPDSVPEPQGHAIEARLYAEDPQRDFLPATGTFHRFEFASTAGLRVDSGIESGSTVGTEYDPMIAKVIAHGPTRQEAAGHLAASLRQAVIHGSTTNLALLVRVLEHPEFLEGQTDTHFLLRHDPTELGRPLVGARGETLAAVAASLADQAITRQNSAVHKTIPSGWRNSPSALPQRGFIGPHGPHDISYSASEPFTVEGLGIVTPLEVGSGRVELAIDGTAHSHEITRYGSIRFVAGPEGLVKLETRPRFAEPESEEDEGSLHAPMPGKIIRVDIELGQDVTEGQAVIVLEAMKMEHTLRSPVSGKVARLNCSAGDQVESGAVLAVVEDHSS